ncbi:type I 3-dehydroquinate dehydratase [Aneurinibacillus migulanus]|uniref:3-dehydroquinate dehydratase n=1 Tax=Aneurinibacillus migulanus TaxID=47500 RepID=A0A1G8W492_ANEMI|nr:type I 3-dehydroquinate dehydratase [Aneurinibacillus migulanus]MED0895025.1 type I 3-dehydroquinate dehydratase [Aneurinibacillus migulanus]MED1614815.1 type I 3-dehydroquinate dehydratase [Aneurinibacillus migulanus]SDJ72310.1 3-dehydroquinate dehydratase [Aneurinibacillus migulanus]
MSSIIFINERGLIIIETIKQIELTDKRLGDGKRPLICTPLVGKTQEVILSETEKILAKQPDLLEWRVDFFEGISDTYAVIDLAKSIKQMAGDTPLIFTRRSFKEGGEPISLSESEVVSLYSAICESRNADIIDYELINTKEDINHLRNVSKEHGIKMIMSYHNFDCTPEVGTLNKKLIEAERMQADIAKIAVMPNHLEDVLTLLRVTLDAKQKLKIPVITMSMGAYGSLTRMFGGAFGSAVTFAVGENSSAPGQVPIEDMKTVLAILQRAIDEK